MKMFEASLESVVYRFILMMAIVIATISFGLSYLAILAVPVFLSAMLGIKLKENRKAMKHAVVKNIEGSQIAA